MFFFVKQQNAHLRRWSKGAVLSRRQMALLCAALWLGLLLGTGICTWSRDTAWLGEALRQDTLRLHIPAASGSVPDQTAKLYVRDAVLPLTRCGAADAASKQQALCQTARHLLPITLAAQRALLRLGLRYAVQASLVNMYFDTRQYADFTLPAGRYDALRLELGDGPRHGRNWWCVLYPGLCLAACGGYDDPRENDLVAGDCILRLRAVELWQQYTAGRQDRTLLHA